MGEVAPTRRSLLAKGAELEISDFSEEKARNFLLKAYSKIEENER